MRLGEAVFVDSSAWIALAAACDGHHAQGKAVWQELESAAARLQTSVPVVIETFTFLDRNGSRRDALGWSRSLASVPRLTILPCGARELAAAWVELEQTRLQGLSLVDATSFVLMRAHHIARAFTFDYHFAAAGFKALG